MIDNKIVTLPFSIFLSTLLPRSRGDIIVSPSYTVPAVADVRLPVGKTVYHSNNGRNWTFLPYREESCRRNFPLPPDVIRKIGELIDNDIEFDDLWLAHETYDDQASWMPPPSVVGVQKSEWALHLLDDITIQPVSLADLLDPILFGCKHNADGTSTLYVIDAWEW